MSACRTKLSVKYANDSSSFLADGLDVSSSSSPSSFVAPVASSSSLMMMMMMESEPTEANRSLTAPSGELLRVETAQVVPAWRRPFCYRRGGKFKYGGVRVLSCVCCLPQTYSLDTSWDGAYAWPLSPGSGRPPGSRPVQSRPSASTSTATAESAYAAVTSPPSPTQVSSLRAPADPLQAPVRAPSLLVSPLATTFYPVSTASTCAISPPSAVPPPPLDIPPAVTQPSQVAQPATQPARPHQPLLSKPPSSTPPPTPSTAHSRPSLDVIFESSCSTLQHVPKGARDCWDGLVSDVFSTVCRDPSNLVAWREVFMLPCCILANPARGGRSHWRDTLNLVRARIRKWKADQIPDLWADVMTVTDVHARRRKKSNKTLSLEQLRRKANARCAKRAIGNGKYRKAMQALSSDGVAQATPEDRNEMLAKHPQAPPLTTPQIQLRLQFPSLKSTSSRP